ncbi:hypothetical protein CCY01nite_06640 [Chitinophaga cymbidii]|uniref:EF-hand domain-containing protein n=2 Tax=Chitinophaga cymbidii TaxID=1096750 RepID=A0A512RFI9_9BACT|nr:hypothetical protein CCY01nite_06640 [Chitinophaga cymbidii]
MEYPLNSQEKSKEEQSTNISDFDECEELFNAMDQDGSGDISGEEWSSAGGDPDDFQTLDTDQSGSLDFSEWSIACID